MDKKLIAELKKRVGKEELNIDTFCFDKQLKFIKDPAKFKTAVCSRRAGKTLACAADLWDTASKTPDVNVLYLTLSRTSAKRIIWNELVKLQKKYDPDAKVDNTELYIVKTNGSTVYVSGAKDENEVAKWRGMALKKIYIDEAQSFRPYIKNLVDDILVPALYDYDGSLILIGTPGPICAGYFYETSTKGTWGRHKWTILDNPWIKIKSGKEPAELLRAERERRGITEADPTYRRESLGEWVPDSDALVFKFDGVQNTYINLPKGRMEYIFGIDIGYDDSDAIAVLGYSYEDKCVYLVEEYIKSKQNITSLVEQINKMRLKYNPVRMVMDAGALGKKIQAEIQTRHTIPLEAADKNRKLEFIELLNDDLRTAKFKAYVGSRFEQDCMLVQWDSASTAGKRFISDAYHSDANDAVLYAWRECKHYLYQAPEVQPEFGSEAYMARIEEQLAAELIKEKNKMPDGPTDDDMAFISNPDSDWDD